jgi:hypothetical protein
LTTSWIEYLKSKADTGKKPKKARQKSEARSPCSVRAERVSKLSPGRVTFNVFDDTLYFTSNQASASQDSYSQREKERWRVRGKERWRVRGKERRSSADVEELAATIDHTLAAGGCCETAAPLRGIDVNTDGIQNGVELREFSNIGLQGKGRGGGRASERASESGKEVMSRGYCAVWRRGRWKE